MEAAPTSPELSTKCYGIQKAPPPLLTWFRIATIYGGTVAAFVVYPLTWPLFWLFVASYAVRMLGMEVANHRYFAHRAFRAGRAMQFVLGCMACLAGQRGPLWWAASHHVHHKHADKPGDPHSPVVLGFWTSHAGWFMNKGNIDTNLDLVSYYASYPELRWLNKHYAVPFWAAVLALFLAGHYGLLGTGVSGLSAVCWGGFVPTTLVVNITSLVNSIGHGTGGYGGFRRYDTGDASLNRPLLALLSMGAGWHNNHHRYAAAGRAGFAWYEVDVSYYVLRLLALLGLVSDLRPVPRKILEEGGIRGAGEARNV